MNQAQKIQRQKDIQTIVVLWKDVHTDHRFLFSNDPNELAAYWYCWNCGEWNGKPLDN